MNQKLPIKKRIQYQAEYRAGRLAMAASAVVPLAWMRAAGAGLGWSAYRVFGLRRRVAEENIRTALGEISSDDVRRIGTGAYMNLGRSVAECFTFHRMSRDRLLSIVRVEGIAHLEEAFRHGKGAILYSGHFGNWELLGATVARCGFPIHATDTNHSNKWVHKIINELRAAQGLEIIGVDRPLRDYLSLLDANKAITYLADRDAGKHGFFVDFFGRPASTLKGPAVFAIRRGCPVVPCFLVRESAGRHRAVFEQPAWADPKLGREAAMLDLTRRLTERLEWYVRRYPEQYLWGHRRWKTRPNPRPPSSGPRGRRSFESRSTAC